MPDFIDLPLEFLPLIFENIAKPQHLSACSLVNRAFNTFATPRLYERIFIFAWHKGAKLKVVLLFDTLTTSPHLARHVRKLDIRDFPKGLTLPIYRDLHDLCPRGLTNCVNLKSCTWTRDGSLNSAILEALLRCSQLEELEINGNDSPSYSTAILPQFSNLRKISLIMPSISVLDILPSWLSVTNETLRNLTLICKASSLITDTMLESIAPSLHHLEHFHITGCPKVTQRGILAVLSSNDHGLLSLGLEGLSQAFDMTSFSRECPHLGSLNRLRTITLTVQQTPLQPWMQGVVNLLSTSPLESFQVYSTAPFPGASLDDEFCNDIVTSHGARLTRFSVHRIYIGMSAVRDICSRCPQLEQLFIVADRTEYDELRECLALAPKLRSVHVHTNSVRGMLQSLEISDALSLVRQCPWSVTQIGINNRVFQVRRELRINDDDEEYIEPRLTPMENPDVPEPFLVVRT
ncbi:hypothetical protein SERLA73DRAFT_179271 [Serpula lacrymans var. lacrymans S7.3]|uniref:F-box domain-containing protein n=2 Tax=Serpula lacrymans var. lacrymans TaxID=341189 RepID=F8PRT6_SERL3|nr:uncharacterized protein SERLADRAFT_464309 [Serpula lacrymans var. lacrymans S7.9]EGO01171.1 hypothetical protein SERLA73DRAFT_179271 [Serpula lacrymans var. lacrymans S7.3]EGO26820.1 hypothetical protein SERLADRAFT_464309 [Serpula lacrymans var. lacrymans S7.9]